VLDGTIEGVGVGVEKVNVFLAARVRETEVFLKAWVMETLGVDVRETGNWKSAGIMAQANNGKIKMLNTLTKIVVLKLNIDAVDLQRSGQAK